MTARWVARKFQEKLRVCLGYKYKEIKHDIWTRFQVDVSITKYWRVKQIALETIRGSHNKYYGSLPNYCKEIRRKNKSTIVIMKVERFADGLQFQRLYIDFQALKIIVLVACRPIFVLDGCILKWI